MICDFVKRNGRCSSMCIQYSVNYQGRTVHEPGLWVDKLMLALAVVLAILVLVV